MLNLHTELYHINTYLELEKARFEEKLQVTMDIEEDLDCMVPSFILQLSMEKCNPLQELIEMGFVPSL